MKTFLVSINGNAKTDKMGDSVVMASCGTEAVELMALEFRTPASDFNAVEFTSGIVYKTMKSAWDGYH